MEINFKNTVERVTLDLIYKLTTPEYIYFLYINDFPNLNKFYFSPFKREKNPSFKFYLKNGNLLFKDFSSGNQGDCIEFVKLIEQCTFQKALDIIYEKITKGSLRKLKKVSKEIQVDKTLEGSDHLIELITRDYTDFDLQYWDQYEIDKELLIKYNIKPCDKVWTNKNLWYTNVENNPCYRYVFNGKYKLYKPLEKNKKLKFNSNCSNIKNIQGLKYIFNSDKCFITKSYKDIIVLNEFTGIPSIALHGEGHIPSKELIEALKSKYKDVILFYDNDVAGIKTANRIKQIITNDYNLSINSIMIPEYLKEQENIKDPSDFVKRYDSRELNKLINFLLDGK